MKVSTLAKAAARRVRDRPSSLTIRPVATKPPAASVAFTGAERRTLNRSSASETRSPITHTPTVRSVCPGAKTTVPDAAT